MGVQVVVQILGLFSGILLVRALRKEDYAFFTLANTLQGTMTLLADIGISSGLLAIGGKIWQDRFRFGQLINTALQLRHYLVAATMTLIGPVLLWMLIRTGCPFSYALVITLVALAGVGVQVSNGVLVVMPRLHLQIDRVQKLDLVAASFRLGLLLLAYAFFLNAGVAVIAATSTFAVQNLILKRWARRIVDMTAPPNSEDRSALIAIIKKQAPNDVFYCIQGQILVWLISLFGNTENIAEVGALGRLAVLFSIIHSSMVGVVLPRFARCQSLEILRKRYWQIVGGYFFLGVILTTMAALFPDELLWILGKQYANLRQEVLLMVIGVAFYSVLTIIVSLNLSKTWVPAPWLNISAVLLSQAALLFVLDVSTVRGVLLLNILSTIPPLLLWGYMAEKHFQSS
jgi:O-antigen/teichoic acid export membrane protein